jgi:8-oxo-(d)GTP phosphatase
MTGPRRATVRAAGGVLLTDGDSPQVLVIHRPAYDDWSLPKGKLDPGESWHRAAVREIEEETGVLARLHTELQPSRYRDNHGRDKLVRWWSMRTLGSTGARAADGEVDELRWVNVGDAAGLLTYDSDRALVADAVRVRDHRIVLLVRHGDAAGLPGAPDDQRPLTERGHHQAWQLADLLAPFHTTTIRSSPAQRCQQTMVHTALVRGLDVAIDPRLAESTSIADPAAFLAGLDDGTILCTHGPVVGQIIAHLHDRGLVHDDPVWPPASAWLIGLDAAGTPTGATRLVDAA